MAVNSIDSAPIAVPNQEQKPSGQFSRFPSIFGRFCHSVEQLNTRRKNLQDRLIRWLRENITKAINIFIFTFTPSPFDPRSPQFVKRIDEISNSYSKTKDAVDSILEGFGDKRTFFVHLDILNSSYKQAKETMLVLEEFLEELNLYAKQLPIQKRVESLLKGYKEINQTLEIKIKEKPYVVLKRFNECCGFFQPESIPMPKEIRQYLIEQADKIEQIFVKGKNLSGETYNQFQRILDALKKNNSIEYGKSQMVPLRALGLPNVGNSCYMNAALEALFCFEETRKKLHQPLKIEPVSPLKMDANEAEKRGHEWRMRQANEALPKRKELQKHLINVVDTPVTTGFTNWMEYVFTLMVANPVRELRDCFFKNRLHPELADGEVGEQRDSAKVIDLIMDRILGEKFRIEKVASSQEIPGRIFYSLETEGDSSLQAAIGDKPISLQEIVSTHFSIETVANLPTPTVTPRRFIPQEGILTDQEKAKNLKVPVDKSFAPASFETFVRIKKLPDVMAITLKRFEHNDQGLFKNNTEVSLPKDLILDLQQAVSSDEKGELALYEIQSVVIHSGNLNGGHYTSNVRIGDKFFHTNDDQISEISRSHFVEQKDAYVILLKRIKC